MSTTIDELDEISSSAARISELIRSSDLSTPVPHLPRWNVRNVAAHLGGVHRWATGIVLTRSMDGSGSTASKLDGAELCDWFDEGVEELLAALGEADSEDPCPNFNPGSPKNIGWWRRRQMHETTVHRWDVEHALGSTTPIAPAVAADGIDEFLDVFVRTRGKQTLTGPLTLATTRPARAWTLTPAEKEGRVDVASGRSGTAAAELVGKPAPLLLMLWGRMTPSEAGAAITGDQDVANSLTGAK